MDTIVPSQHGQAQADELIILMRCMLEYPQVVEVIMETMDAVYGGTQQ
jgi:hypothetical protein